MMFTVLVGLGSGYFLWGTRVARLTEALSSSTLEIDTMRARLAAPRGSENPEGTTVKSTDELRVISESIAAFRQELAEQKALIEKSAAAASAAPDAGASTAELRTARNDLAVCIADKKDLELRLRGTPSPTAAPAYQPPAPPLYRPPGAAQTAPPSGPGLDDPRY